MTWCVAGLAMYCCTTALAWEGSRGKKGCEAGIGAGWQGTAAHRHARHSTAVNMQQPHPAAPSEPPLTGCFGGHKLRRQRQHGNLAGRVAGIHSHINLWQAGRRRTAQQMVSWQRHWTEPQPVGLVGGNKRLSYRSCRHSASTV